MRNNYFYEFYVIGEKIIWELLITLKMSFIKILKCKVDRWPLWKTPDETIQQIDSKLRCLTILLSYKKIPTSIGIKLGWINDPDNNNS